MAEYPALKVDHLSDILEDQTGEGRWVVPRPNGLYIFEDDGESRCFIEFIQQLTIATGAGKQDDTLPLYPRNTQQQRQQALFNAAEAVVEDYEVSDCGEDTDALDRSIGELRLAMLPLYGKDDELAVVGDRLTVITHHQRAALERVAAAALAFSKREIFTLLLESDAKEGTVVTLQRPFGGTLTIFDADDLRAANELLESAQDVEY